MWGGTVIPLARHEPMSAVFAKFHLSRPCVLHVLSAPDTGEPHDHPFALDITILRGGYVEEVVDTRDWSMIEVTRLPGATFRIKADHVHRIVRLLDGECWTAAEYGPWQRPSGFSRWADGQAERRVWNEGWG